MFLKCRWSGDQQQRPSSEVTNNNLEFSRLDGQYGRVSMHWKNYRTASFLFYEESINITLLTVLELATALGIHPKKLLDFDFE